MKLPMITKGVEQQIHNTNKVSIVVKGTAELEDSAHKNKSMIKKIEKEIAGYKNEVIIALKSQFLLSNIL